MYLHYESLIFLVLVTYVSPYAKLKTTSTASTTTTATTQELTNSAAAGMKQTVELPRKMPPLDTAELKRHKSPKNV